MNPIEFAYRSFLRKRFPLPTDFQVRSLEQHIGVSFPGDFREFLLTYNGGYFRDPVIKPSVEGCPEESLAYICGVTASHIEAELGNHTDLSLFDDNNPPKIIPIGGTPLGSLIVLDVAPGEGLGTIYFKQAFGEFYYLADGIEEFFSRLHDPIDLDNV